ncbi:MAG: radical SAM protein, partial [Candidatus Muiribacteriota bacterium]
MNSRVLQLETSKICNVKCSFCYKSDKNYKNSNINEPFMTLSEIKKYFADNISWQKVILFNNGEFFVNPEWKQIFEFVVSRISNYSEKCEILINTNTILLDNDSADFIINTVKNSKMILRLTFSINAYSKKVYENLISENLRDRVYENAENFIIKAINYENICANPQIIVMKENFNEIE